MTISKEESIKRLTYLKESLVSAKLAEVELNMCSWAKTNKSILDVEGNLSVNQLNECGTVCCIGGFGGTHPELQKLGLSLKVFLYKPVLELHGGMPTIGDSIGNDLARFFGISQDEGYALFSEASAGCLDTEAYLIRKLNVDGYGFHNDTMTLDGGISIINYLINLRKEAA